MRRRLLVDVSGLAYAAAYKVDLSYKGKKVNVVYGVLRTLEKLAESLEPEEMILCFDGGSELRKEIYPEYKENRKKNPKHEEMRREVARQLPVLRGILDALPVLQVQKDGYEADDLVEAIASFLHLEHVGIVTKDQDLYQLAEPPRCVIFNKEGGEEKLALRPKQYITYKVLVGDTSDNIKGVDQIGPVNAGKLIKRFKTLKGIMAHAKEEGKLGAMPYKQALTRVRRNLKLVRLGDILTGDDRSSVVKSYARARLLRGTNKKLLRERLLEVGFSSFVSRLSRLITTFKCMERTPRTAPNEAKADHHNSEERGERKRKAVSHRQEGGGYTRIIVKVVESKRSCREDQGSKRRPAQGPRYARRIRKKAPVGMAPSGKRRGDKRATRSDSGEGSDGSDKRATVEKWRCRTKAFAKRLSSSPEVLQRGELRRRQALFLLQAFHQNDEGWGWLRRQSRRRLEFVSSMISALDSDPEYAPDKKALAFLEKLKNDYASEMPDWMLTDEEIEERHVDSR